MFGHIKHIAVVMVLWFALASCDKTIHEYPGAQDLKIIVNCEADLTAPEHFVVVKPNANGNDPEYIVRAQDANTKGTRFTEYPVYLRCVVDLYRVKSSNAVFVERKVVYSGEIYQTMEDPIVSFETVEFTNVKAEQYKVLVWCDYVDDERLLNGDSWYYNTDDLTHITYSDIEVIDNNDKDVFTNMATVDLTKYYYEEGSFQTNCELTLERPKGRWKCIAEDVNDYIKDDKSVDNITAVVTYVQYVSAGYNVEEQKPNYFEATRTFVTKARFDEFNELELCYDYVFVNGKQTNVKINFAFYDGDISYDENGAIVGNKISECNGLTVPLKRNMESVIRGNMLTTNIGTGGFGIDSEFENEIVVPWGD